jgi:hypothetical protein
LSALLREILPSRRIFRSSLGKETETEIFWPMEKKLADVKDMPVMLKSADLPTAPYSAAGTKMRMKALKVLRGATPSAEAVFSRKLPRPQGHSR